MKRFRYSTWCLIACLACCAHAWADVPGDGDGDADVDFSDFTLFSGCQRGPGLTALDFCREPFDFEFDGDVDMGDFAAFQLCFSGEDMPKNFGCASHQARIEEGCLHIVGTADDSALALRLRAGAPFILEVDVGNDGVADFEFDRSQFDCVLVSARGGDDLVMIDESNGIFTDVETTTIDGGRGNDTLVGGSGGETFIGGDGNDTVFLGAGDDRFIWNPGDDTDFIEGDAGIDTVVVNGGNGAEGFTATANGTRVRFDRVSPTAFSLDIGSCENLVLNANGGNDSFTATGNLAALIQITVDGGAGNDTLIGSNGPDVLIGGDNDDFIDGNQGNDLVFGGSGNDTFQWDPGDGSDTLEGQSGNDVLMFNGSNVGENFDLAANGPRLRLARNVGNIIMDLDGIEQIMMLALGGADLVTVGSLAGTSVAQVSIDLGAVGGIADGQADTVAIVGGPGADVFDISADAGFTVVSIAAAVRVNGYEFADQIVIAGVGGDVVNANGSNAADTMSVTLNGAQERVDATGYSAGVAVSGALSLSINGLGGPDSISCTGNLASLPITLTLDGGPGDDIVLGSNGADLLIGGEGNDLVDGNQGNDLAFLGAGNDTFQWDPGDGNDTIEGQDGQDTLVFNGSNANETFDLSANGSRLRCARNVGNIVLDVDDIEQLNVNLFGGADIVAVNSLSGLDTTQVNIDLATSTGIGDAQPDTIIVNGTNLPDTINVAANANAVEVFGLTPIVRITHAEAAVDTLLVNGLGGLDTLTSDPGVAALILLILNQ